MQESEVFEKIYRDYLKEVSRLEPDRARERLGVQVVDEAVIIPFYGTPHHISAQGISDDQGRRPSHSVSVILCKYLLLCPDVEPTEADWVTYKDFKDAAPFVGGFLNNVERPIARTFSGRLNDLRRACADLTGRPVEGLVTADLVMRFEALPKVPVLMVFNDRDEDFPAHCSILFERRAEKYLDMECLAIAGWALSDWLKQKYS